VRFLAVNWRDIADPLGGGAELHLHEILRRAVTAGHEVDLVVAAYPGAAARDEIDGVHVHRRGHWLVANWVLPWVVRRLLHRHRYDLVIDDINKIPFYAPLYSGTVPVVAVVPHLFGATVFRETNPLFAAYVWAAERAIPLVYRDVDFLAISPSTRDDLAGRGVAADRIHVIYCGLDQTRFALAEPPPRSSEPLLVTWSRLRRYKSIDVVLRAFQQVRQQLPDARLVVVGRGPDENRLRRLAQRLDLGASVEFSGYLAHADLVSLLHRAHVFLNPSPKEGWGLTVVEANQCGLPVVASDRPGLRDSVRPGQTGLLVPYGDVDAFAAAALRLLREPALWERLHAGARRWAGGFSWERCGRESLALLEAAARRQRPLVEGRA
jgi:glycosyltransferase involved in cell wall biosynthesis